MTPTATLMIVCLSRVVQAQGLSCEDILTDIWLFLNEMKIRFMLTGERFFIPIHKETLSIKAAFVKECYK